MRRILPFFLLTCLFVNAKAQQPATDIDSVRKSYIETIQRLKEESDSLRSINKRYQSELKSNNELLEKQLKAMKEKEALIVEKEQLYREALSNTTVDRAKLQAEITSRDASIEAKSHEINFLQRDIDQKNSLLAEQKESMSYIANERDRYRNVIDSLQKEIVKQEKENIRKEEQNKYLEERAKAAEAQTALATSRKKKVRPIQGVGMRFFRSPDWEIQIELHPDENGNTTYGKTVRNRNSGNVEFDLTSGASVMLWDMTKYFNKSHSLPLKDTTFNAPTIKKFDQEFAYDVGIYAGFGGNNLFKNFYIGPSFRFVDFFYLIIGVNIAEYELLMEQYSEGMLLPQDAGISSITTKEWKIKPFLGISIDLDFLSYIKK